MTTANLPDGCGVFETDGPMPAQRAQMYAEPVEVEPLDAIIDRTLRWYARTNGDDGAFWTIEYTRQLGMKKGSFELTWQVTYYAGGVGANRTFDDGNAFKTGEGDSQHAAWKSLKQALGI